MVCANHSYLVVKQAKSLKLICSLLLQVNSTFIRAVWVVYQQSRAAFSAVSCGGFSLSSIAHELILIYHLNLGVTSLIWGFRSETGACCSQGQRCGSLRKITFAECAPCLFHFAVAALGSCRRHRVGQNSFCHLLSLLFSGSFITLMALPLGWTPAYSTAQSLNPSLVTLERLAHSAPISATTTWA